MNTIKSRKREKKMTLRAVGMALFLVLAGGVGLHAAIPAIEREALIVLYNATDGDKWRNNPGWKTGALEPDGFGPIGSEGDWYGVDVSGDHVSRINLLENNLGGIIPSELGNLSNLEYLELSWNNLSGIIPPELGNFSNLTWLSLHINDLSGSIPPELGNLSNLEYLIIYGNRLSGSIPPELGDLSNLEILNLSSNQLSGSIPSQLGNLSRLRHLYLSNNQLSGSIPSSLMDLGNSLNLGIDYNALHTNNDELREFLNNVSWQNWENTQTIAPADITATGFSRTSIRVSWTPIIYIWESGSYRVYYSTTSGGPWNHSGGTASKNDSFYDVTGLVPGTRYYFKILTQTDPHIRNQNTVLSEYSEVVSAVTGSPMAEKDPPFGSFDTPIEGLTARGSIPVTGWALDDSGIDTVKIYRELAGQSVYIGDGIFIEGARPDVAAAYPGYPINTEAGWGYMLLTNFLPNSGNGTFVLHAIATDVNGKTTSLGTKTIQCDNANAAKPFGAIDTPTQGGLASGAEYLNWGWALTPQPNTIPTDGSFITVWVDGVPLGNPVYNRYRSDIATLFPNYNNSDGAIGYFYLDTTAYQNGVHTIQWTVRDDAGNYDGIGSRYFSIQNTQNRAQAQTQAIQQMDIKLHDIPLDTMSSLKVKTGYNPEHPNEEKRYGHNGTEYIEIPELGRLELHLTDESAASFVGFHGYQLVRNGLRPLPIGSYLDKKRGIFYWQAGVAFIGNYHLVFFKTDRFGNQTRKEVQVTIKPKE